jgi:MFS family permease
VTAAGGQAGHALAAGFRQLAGTLKIRHLKTVLLFLLSYWFYIDGVDTIIRMAVDYGLSLGFESTDLIIALLIVQFVGFPAALVFGKLGPNWGVRKSIYLAIGIYMAVTLWGAMMTNKLEFYIMAVVIGLVQGGIQALSRSYYSRLIPGTRRRNSSGSTTCSANSRRLSPTLMGVVGLTVRRAHAGSAQRRATGGDRQLASRWGIASILVLFLLGAVLFISWMSARAGAGGPALRRLKTPQQRLNLGGVVGENPVDPGSARERDNWALSRPHLAPRGMLLLDVGPAHDRVMPGQTPTCTGGQAAERAGIQPRDRTSADFGKTSGRNRCGAGRSGES